MRYIQIRKIKFMEDVQSSTFSSRIIKSCDLLFNFPIILTINKYLLILLWLLSLFVRNISSMWRYCEHLVHRAFLCHIAMWHGRSLPHWFLACTYVRWRLNQIKSYSQKNNQKEEQTDEQIKQSKREKNYGN